MRKSNRVLLPFSRVLVSFVFLFSGFIKGVDPLGSTFKLADYFTAFGIGFFEPIALPLAIMLSTAEFTIGVSILFGFRFRIGAWAVLLFISFFTVLTLILALTNPVSDCGCFGDAIIMTNWQTFFKNLILVPFVILIFFNRNAVHTGYNTFLDWSLAGIFAVLFFILEMYCILHLPVLDFRPYSVGTYIPDQIIIPDGVPPDVYKTFLYYEKDGKIKEFTEENYPWQDTAWVFVDTKHVLVEKGYEPPIHDFAIVSPELGDITDMVLNDENYSIILISYNLTKADSKALLKANELAIACNNINNCSFYFLTSSVELTINTISEDLNLTFQFSTTDEIALKTIVRSNPGLMLLKDGVILTKLHHRDFPEPANLDNHLLSTFLENHRKSSERMKIFFLVSVFISLTLLIQIIFPRTLRY